MTALKKKTLRESFAAAIRPACPADLDEIVAIDANSFGSECWPRDLLKEYLDKSLESPLTLMMVVVADDGKVPAGYVLAEEDGAGESTIMSIAVSESYRGRGLGRELLDRVSESLRNLGAEKIVLQAEAGNAGAIHLYETSGFVKTADLPGYYHGTDGIEMTCEIARPKTAAPKMNVLGW